MEKYKMPREHLMQVSIKNHHNASMNPKAQINLSIKQIMQNRKTQLDKHSSEQKYWKDEFEFLKRNVIIQEDCMQLALLQKSTGI